MRSLIQREREVLWPAIHESNLMYDNYIENMQVDGKFSLNAIEAKHEYWRYAGDVEVIESALI